MSHALGHGILHQALTQPKPEHPKKCCSVSSGNPAYHVTTASLSNQSAHQLQNPLKFTKLYEKGSSTIGRMISIVPCAVLTTNPASELTRRFNLDGNSELQVDVSIVAPNSQPQVDIQITNSNSSFILHWGAICGTNRNWSLPSCRPDGTKVYKKKALRTPFRKSGSNMFLSLAIDDPQIQGIEFLVFDEAKNKWFKDNGQNFYIQLPRSEKSDAHNSIPSNISVPEDLVQIQAYMRWERGGKQAYTPEQEKEEYEAARTELLEEVARGASIEEIRTRLTEKDDKPKERTSTLEKNIPDELVQIQAFIRWEKAGKPNYSPDQQLEEYEAARTELLEEVARGASIEEIRTRLTEKDDKPKERTSTLEKNIPDELVQIQAFIRWEKAGKPNYSPDQQLREFEEARKELQLELDQGSSIDEIRKKITKGNTQTTNVSQHLKTKRYFTGERIQRKKRDIMQFLNKYVAEPGKEKKVLSTQTLTKFELWSKAKEEKDGGSIVNKKLFKLGDKELLVLVIKHQGKTKVYVATDMKEPVVLHWALSERAGEWMAPSLSTLPPCSVLMDRAFETPFVEDSVDAASKLQSIEIEVDGANFVGLPFVLLSNGRWINNNGSDFYVEFSSRVEKVVKDTGDGNGTAKALLNRIAELETEAERSFMHRFNIAADLTESAKDFGELGFAGLLVWLRFMATRQLTWNRNYNVKPREISKAQDRLIDLLQDLYKSCSQHREILRMIMSSVGRGGEGDVGQRIRDEILVIQRKNDCKGGMMEEWHQKLHNNTSPDDVIICQALIDYIKSDFNIDVYWSTLKSNGITKERLLSYDRAIHSEPKFRIDQKEGLLRDLGKYLRTLKAVHSGADLESAISTCLGYKSEGRGFMVGVHINPVSGLPSGSPELLQFILEHVEDKNVEPLLESLLEARAELRPLLHRSHERLKDLIFLDIALDSTVRTAIERGYEDLNKSGPEKVMYFITLVLENLVLSSDNNEELIYCLKGWNHARDLCRSKNDQWALYTKSVLDRTRLALSSKAEHYHLVLQPSAEYLGCLLGVEQWAVNIFTEEIIRAGSAASLSSLLNRLDPVLRETAHLGSWQVISPVEVVGSVVVVDKLLSVQNESYRNPTIILANSVKGEEEIPDGVVAVLTPDMPDVLSHVSVRARNSKVCFATCFDPKILLDLQAREGKLLQLKPTSAGVIYSEVKGSELADPSSLNQRDDLTGPSLTLVRKQFAGRYAISADEFSSEMVGAKSRNISYLKGKVPSWVGIPTSVALPFGVFEKVLADDSNKTVATRLQQLKNKLVDGDVDALGEIRKTVLELVPPPQLVQELKDKMSSSGMPWPGDEGQERWEQAWNAIKKVWASKWNERAYFSTRRVKLDHDYLCMAVLVQEIISADYAFVIHTTNPSSGDSSEIYAEVVKGLGETLVGAYPGRALSFACKKSNLNLPRVLGYPSKPVGLFIRRSIIFRSDSNGEDLEGYAGAGLYDSVPMDEEEKVVLDYSVDPLVIDENFRNSILSSIAGVGSAIEELYGSPQDIEGVVKDGKIFVVQTRPQM